MKKVALLGDSIRQIGYGTRVPEILGGEYDVFQPEDNCRFVKYTLRMLFDFKEQLKDCEVIHWNNGLWDICRLYKDGETFTCEEEYVANMIRVAEILKGFTPNVIFATTTPVRKENPFDRNEDIDRFNALIVPELESRGFLINDLNGLLKNDTEKYICDDFIHLTQAGIEICAEQVARFIKKFEV
ncbi:MAG: SGNH/GDSL hydrolase family protein [Clostridia bacterium]|nr:SGNH/GDSL hydrolase family protein [Clostridia bacterium]